jgi:hypothetical protein
VRKAERLRLADRLDRGEDPHLIAAELRGLAPGRPRTAAIDRLRTWQHRAAVAEAIYAGTPPADLVPAGDELAVVNAKGNRLEADDLAATYCRCSVRAIQDARQPKPIGRHFAMFKELVKHFAGARVRR